ncbi:MAG TPA: aspartate kinase [Terriglobales bacterium]|nr:aspartate kinase [Terriglobales bacterium]
MIVMKFGGTSVESVTAIRRVAGIVRGRLHCCPVVVASAMGGVTDRLVEMGAAAASGRLNLAIQLLRQVSERHHEAARELLNPAGFAHLQPKLDRHFTAAENLLCRIAVAQRVTPRASDELLSFGELVSSELVAAAFVAAGLNAVHVDARECIVTDARHTKAVPKFEESQVRLAANIELPLRSGCVPVLGGFIAATQDGVPTTLGRGGSDFTAALVGAALRAERIEIWTDVPGIMTTDPAICPRAQLIPAVSFAEAAELAQFGAKVLHPGTLVPALEHNIPVHVLNSREPGCEGTRIERDAPPQSSFRAISVKKGMTVVNVAGKQSWDPRGFLPAVLAIFDRHNCHVDAVATAQSSISLAVGSKEALPAIAAELEPLGVVSCENSKAIVCVVGDDLHRSPKVAAKVLTTMADADVKVRMISHGASDISINFVIEERDVVDTVSRLHHALFSTPREEAALTAASNYSGPMMS